MIVIYIIILVVIIVIFEIFNNFDNINRLFIPNTKQKIEKFTKISDDENLLNNFDKTEIPLNNSEKRLIKFNNEIRYSPIEHLNIEYDDNEIIIKDFKGKICIKCNSEEEKSILKIFLIIDDEWVIMNSDIYMINENSTIKIIYISNDVKKIDIYTSK